MRHVDDYRNPHASRRLLEAIRATTSCRRTVMEVCGGQTHGLLQHGIDSALHDVVELIHGPGCPVCVTPAADIDFAIWLSQQPATTLVSFGDMLRVPGTERSLRDAQAASGSVRMAYSPLDAVQFAQDHPTEHFVFFAVGFETTTPATALAVLQAQSLGLPNFSMLVSHVRVQPAMEMIMQQPDCRVEGFLAAGHVCSVSGFDSYGDFASRHRVPVVVTGFEPVDLLAGILACVRQIEAGQADVENVYRRSVRQAGNPQAQQWIDRVYEVDDRPWRGLGTITAGGYRLREEFAEWDTRQRFLSDAITSSGFPGKLPLLDESLCPSGRVLTGQLKPPDCPHFGQACTPEHPQGAPMVSSEGACAAYYRAAR